MLVVLVGVGAMARTSVAIESQPAEFFRVTLYVPAAGYVLLFQVYGNWLGQTLMLVVLVGVGAIASTNVAIESQPAAFFRVTLYVPAAG